MDAATRDRLGDLFCGWYCNRHDDSEINFAAGDDWKDAIPVRIRDVADEGWQAWLATAGRQDDGTMIWERISAAIERFRGCDCAVLIAPAWNIDGRELIHDGTHRACALGGAELVRRIVVVSEPALVRTVRQVTPSFLANATAVLLICTDLDRAEAVMGTQGRDILSLLHAGAAAENVALAAPALGVGICFVRSANDTALREVLDLPEHVRPDILIGVGHPAPTPSPRPRMQRPIVFRDRFGTPWREETST